MQDQTVAVSTAPNGVLPGPLNQTVVLGLNSGQNLLMPLLERNPVRAPLIRFLPANPRLGNSPKRASRLLGALESGMVVGGESISPGGDECAIDSDENVSQLPLDPDLTNGQTNPSSPSVSPGNSPSRKQ